VVEYLRVFRHVGFFVFGAADSCNAGRVIATGCCDSRYVRQLAVAVVLEAFEASEYQSDKI
jgi:hypothetical protein